MTQEPTDLLARPMTAAFWWGLPLAAGWAADASPVPQMLKTSVWAVSLAWMSAGCALNAWRCRRPHCYVAAPVLLLAAAAVAASTAGFAPMGPHTPSYEINASLAIALLSLLVEVGWRKHRSR